jgi:hypothetical protein
MRRFPSTRLPAALAGALAALLAAACTPRTVVPDVERERSRAALEGQSRYLRASHTVHPLFGDPSLRLLLDAPPAEVDLLRGATGDVTAPPPAELTLPPGTPVRVLKVEFPTAGVIARRVVTTPRYHPWVYLQVGGDARGHVLVLPQTVATADDLVAEAGRSLVADDPTPSFQAMPDAHRDAIRRKELLEGMTTLGVEMAWGLPERRVVDRPTGTEEWVWPGGKRRAFFADDRLVRWER